MARGEPCNTAKTVMKKIDDLLQRVKGFNEALESGRLVQAIIQDNEPYIVDMNAEEQLYEQGINRLGVKISDYMPYSPLTIEIKKAKGQPTDRVTLRDEGDFEGSFYIEADDKQFEIKASDYKAPDLAKKYGRQIFGLTDENKAALTWQYLYPDLLNEAKKRIYGKQG